MRNLKISRISLILLCCILDLVVPQLSAQTAPAQSEAEADAEYEHRIKQEVLFGVYIPVDLPDAFNELSRLSAQEDLEQFKSAPEEVVVPKLHFGLGRWISHNWGFYGGSRFSKYLSDLGLEHPDDMIRFVLTTFHRHLNEEPLEAEQLVHELREARALETEQRKAQNPVITIEKRKRLPDDGGGN